MAYILVDGEQEPLRRLFEGLHNEEFWANELSARFIDDDLPDRFELIIQQKDLIADALDQEAANLDGFSGRLGGQPRRLKSLQSTVQLLKQLAAVFRGTYPSC